MARVRRCKFNGCYNMVELPKHYCKQHANQEREYVPRDKQSVHRYNTVTRNRDDNKRQQYSFYRTRQWVYLRQQVLDEQHYLCQYCKADGRVTQGKTVDHLRPLELFNSDGARIDNLVVICSQCHTLKTNWERRYYGTGNANSPTGNVPIDDIKTINRLMKKGT